ncbi:MAG: hypothetical protein AABW91_01685 [Nanoarchaeota archaeon]
MKDSKPKQKTKHTIKISRGFLRGKFSHDEARELGTDLSNIFRSYGVRINVTYNSDVSLKQASVEALVDDSTQITDIVNYISGTGYAVKGYTSSREGEQK